MKKKTQEQFINEVSDCNPNIEIIGDYVNDSTKIKVKCLKCNKTWEARPNTLVRGKGCPYCANNIKKTTKQFINEMQEYNPFIEVKGEYETAHTPIKVKCKICGNEWKAKPYRMLHGARCLNCVKPHTSFMEQFILFSLKSALGDNMVESRNTSAIGMELDIFLPKHRLAIEPGSWLYHEKKAENLDLQKRNLCRKNGIRLITIYDTYPSNLEKPYNDDCYVFEGSLNEYKYPRLIKMIIDILKEIRITNIDLNWNEIANKSYEACHYNSTEDFIKDLKEVAPNIDILEGFKGSHTPILVKSNNCSHPAWRARPYTLLKGNGCPICGRLLASKNRTKTKEKFLEELNKVNPLISIIGEYTKATDNILVKCLECGNEWNPKAYSLLQGRGCPKCRTKQGVNNNHGLTHRKTTDEFKKDLKIINPNIEVLGEYINNKTKIHVKCIICQNEWDAVPQSLLYNHGCPRCFLNNKRLKKNN